MHKHAGRISWLGVVLILFGAALLLDHLRVVHFGFGLILWSILLVVGVVQVARGFARHCKGQVFWGTILFLFSLQFFLDNLDLIYASFRLFSAATLLIVGAGFLMMYLSRLRDVYLLVPTLVLIGVGGALYLAGMGYVQYYDVWWLLKRYWPIVVILLGVTLIIRTIPRSKATP
jgi:hypothetical protein